MELTLNESLDLEAYISIFLLTLRSKSSKETLRGQSVHSTISSSRNTCNLIEKPKQKMLIGHLEHKYI